MNYKVVHSSHTCRVLCLQRACEKQLLSLLRKCSVQSTFPKRLTLRFSGLSK